MLGYPDAAQADAERAISDAREIGQAGTLMFALAATSYTQILCGNYATARMQSEEGVSLADEKGTLLWKAWGTMNQGCVSAFAGQVSDAVQKISSGIAGWRQTGGALLLPGYLPNLAMAYAELDHFDDAWRHIGEAIAAVETTKERWCEAEILRIAGEIALKSAEPNVVKAQVYFERALTVARDQQAKSWELRAAMSAARLCRDQGKPQQARELLSPVYSWFTEGFDTRDLREARALLDTLAS
jgi:predicted ATPase